MYMKSLDCCVQENLVCGIWTLDCVNVYVSTFQKYVDTIRLGNVEVGGSFFQ